MRILVIGASGLVGSHVLAESLAKGHETLGTYRRHPLPDLVPLDLGDLPATEQLIDSFRPDWVVHAAGWTWVDGCEQDAERAFRENCEQPVSLARLCRQRGVRFCYFSTTYVFDGSAGPYSETDAPRPVNVYARAKWEAEQGIQKASDQTALIPRVICVWGKEPQGKNFVYQVLKSLRELRSMTLPSDQLGNPTWAGDIGSWLIELMTEGESGVWNLAGTEENFSRLDWFLAIKKGAVSSGWIPENSEGGFQTISTASLKQPALRPLHAGARTEKIRSFSSRTARAPGDFRGLPPL
jgi:dTDP-4-dehydrorhamnose reductase